MSQQQDDDESTVIRPPTYARTGSTSTASSGPIGQGNLPDSDEEDGLALRPGARLDEFEITRRLGAGGFSIVYLARDHSLERAVALKEYLPSSLATRVGATKVQPRSQHRGTFEAGLKSFVNEAKLLAQFDHPSLVKVFRFWEANGTAYMVMPFYQGVTVKEEVCAMAEPPDEAWLMALLAPLTEALMVIHAEHCYHRDVAPDNVILLAGSAKPLLLDFGAARRVIGDMTQGLTVILKSGYAPVEQYAEIPGMRQGSWTDVYALAALVHWAVTGSTPPASVGRMVNDSFIPLARRAAGRYSDRFLQAIDRALIVLPERRTQTIEAFRHDLGLTGEGADSRWVVQSSDSEASTVIRRVDSDPAAPLTARLRKPDLPITSSETHLQPGTAPHVGRQRANSQADDQTLSPLKAWSPDAAGRTVSADHVDRQTIGRRRAVLVVSALGMAIVGAGLWWELKPPRAEPPRPVRGSGEGAPAGMQQPEARGVADTPNPVDSGPGALATPSTSIESAPTPLPPDSTEPLVPPSPVASAPNEPSLNATEATLTPNTRAARPQEGTKRPPQRRDAGALERAQVEAANRAECDRVYQRLSLGADSPELLDRLKTLKCR